MVVRLLRFSKNRFRSLVEAPYAFRFGDDFEVSYLGVVVVLSCKDL